MPVIRILQPIPGQTTIEKILELLQHHKQGMTVKELSKTLNRSVSMVLRCLKLLMAEGQVYAQLDENGMHLIYLSFAVRQCEGNKSQ
jgi:DNA-binding IclR family transcriptional regulator